MKLIPYQLDESTVAMILRGLDKLPHGEVRATYDTILRQAQAVLAAGEAPPEPPIKPAPAPARGRK
ncbi:MAG: hypothetical protein KF686_03335 [Ramlibacter sp.]|nr:hypothetical protein [Ramlibacter sp.]